MSRLIDADALYEVVSEHVTTVSVCPTVDWARGKSQMQEICLEDIANAPTVGGWISVKDRLPEIDERVLVFGVGKYEYFVGSTMTAITCMSDANLIDCRLKTQPYWLEPWQYYLTDYEITHWMPLPESPKEAEDDAEQ